MNVIQAVGTSLMAYGCALPVCFFPDTKYTNIMGVFIFGVGMAIFIGGSETGYTIKTVEK